MDLFGMLLTVSGLMLFESITSIDNAVINAEVLSKMSERAKRWFQRDGVLGYFRAATFRYLIMKERPGLGGKDIGTCLGYERAFRGHRRTLWTFRHDDCGGNRLWVAVLSFTASNAGSTLSPSHSTQASSHPWMFAQELVKMECKACSAAFGHFRR